MNVEISDGLIEIHDPDIDPTAIMEQIRLRVQKRRQEKGYDQRTFPTFGVTQYPEAPSDHPYDPDLYYYLRLTNEAFAQAETNANLADSPATKLPIVGRAWKLIRREVHNLVLFYVNRAITHQVNVNRYQVNVLNRLTALTEEQQRMIERLQAELDELRSSQKES